MKQTAWNQTRTTVISSSFFFFFFHPFGEHDLLDLATAGDLGNMLARYKYAPRDVGKAALPNGASWGVLAPPVRTVGRQAPPIALASEWLEAGRSCTGREQPPTWPVL